MWHQRFNRHFLKLWKYFLCTKESKNNDFIQQFVPSVSPWRHFGEHHDTCACFGLNVNNACAWWCWHRTAKKLRLNHWCHMDYLTMSLLRFWTMILVVHLLSYGRIRELSDFSRLTSVDLNLKNVYWPHWNKILSDVNSCLFHAITSEVEEMIGSRATWTEVLQWYVTTR